ncbi:MAG: hypothetical protein GXO39_01595 [Thermotogae bacterium]|nr:hypothetical protein [Thermotogota bacterium]
MIYLILILVLLTNALHSVLRLPMDLVYPALPLTREVKRPFALAIYVAMGVIRDTLFLSKPWYSAFLLTLSVITINRLRPHWLILTLGISLFYLTDLLLRWLIWGIRLDMEEAVLTFILIVAGTILYQRFKERDRVVI